MASRQEADQLLHKLLEELKDLKTELSRLQYEHRSVETFKRDVESLNDALIHSTADNTESVRLYLIGVLTDCLTLTRHIISENTKGLDLISENKTLKDKLATLKRMEEYEDKLYAGQLASSVEEVIIRRVFKDSQIKKMPKICKLTAIDQLEKVIVGDKDYCGGIFTEEERKCLEKAWTDLKRELLYDGRHFRCINQLKTLRNGIAHFPFNKEKMESAVRHLPDRALPACYKRECPSLLEMYKKLT